MAVDRRAVFADAVVFTRIRQLNALREVKPGCWFGNVARMPALNRKLS
jgi:hypothetical protein